MTKKRLAILTSHPIQYQVPLFQKLVTHQEIDLMVYFFWNPEGDKKKVDPEFKINLKWDIPLLSGYPYKFLKNYSSSPSSNFWGQINFNVASEIRRGNFDEIIIFGWNSFSNWVAFFTAFLIGTRVFLRAESPLNQELTKPKWKLFLKKIVLKPLFKKISAFLYIGKENRKFYEYYGVPEGKLFFVPYAVDNERFIKSAEELRPKRKELRKNLLGIEDNRPIILFSGKLIEKKRPFDLLGAFETLNTQCNVSHVSLVFVGDGALRPELEKYIKDHKLSDVYFVGFKNQTELPEYYAVADAFVLPSGPGETWGLVVNEAMCFDLPIIVSDIVGCGPDLVNLVRSKAPMVSADVETYRTSNGVKQGENGFVFPLGDIEKLAECLYIVLSGDYKQKSLEIIKNYSHEKDIEGIVEALNV